MIRHSVRSESIYRALFCRFRGFTRLTHFRPRAMFQLILYRHHATNLKFCSSIGLYSHIISGAKEYIAIEYIWQTSIIIAFISPLAELELAILLRIAVCSAAARRRRDYSPH